MQPGANVVATCEATHEYDEELTPIVSILIDAARDEYPPAGLGQAIFEHVLALVQNHAHAE